MATENSSQFHHAHNTPATHDRLAKDRGQITNMSPGERLLCVAAGFTMCCAGVKSDKHRPLFTTVGGLLALRGLVGHSFLYRALGINTAGPLSQRGIRIAQSIVIEAAPAQVYRFWRRFENLPRFLPHLEAVHEVSPNLSKWRARLPGGTAVSWDSELIEDYENELISWQSLPGSQINHAGSVRFVGFERLDGTGTATEVRLIMRYDPPGGRIGDLVARMFGTDPQREVVHGLRNLKAMLEHHSTEAAAADPESYH